MTQTKRLFAMVNTAASRQYTTAALRSFFARTPLEGEEAFILIDNDGSFCEAPDPMPASASVLRNREPRSFAQNVNQMLERAARTNSDLFFLNNDLIFSERWLDPMLIDEPVILCPFSNREAHHRLGTFECATTLTLEQYIGSEHLFEQIAKMHRERVTGYQLVLSMPFFCVKLPYAVYSVVGALDESFGRGGAEDDDYCVRSYLAGFSVGYARQSYVLHFNGKSTWCAESAEQTDERVSRFRRVFAEKWGERLRDLLISHDMNALAELGPLPQLPPKKALRAALERVLSNRQRTPVG